MRKQGGFTLVEFLIGSTLLFIAGLVLASIAVTLGNRLSEWQMAKQARATSVQMARYSVTNHDSILASATWPVTVTAAQIAAAGYPIPTGANAFGQTHELWIFKDGAGDIAPMMVSVGGTAIPSGRLRNIARNITSLHGAGGFIDVATAPNEPGVANAFGSNGLNLAMSVFGKSPGAGHYVDALYLGEAVQTPGITNTALQRFAIPGQPDVNTMHTDLNGGGNSARNFNVVNASFVGAAGKDGASGYPTGWGGGMHTFDAYIEGSAGFGTGGVLNATINNAGVASFSQVTSTSEIYVNNWFRLNGDGGLYSQKWGCGLQIADSSWVRAYNNCGIYTGGQMQAGSMVANGRLTAQEYIQLNGLGNVGWSCGPDGLMGRAADNSGAIICHGGVWVLMSGMVDSIQVVSPGSSCGNDNSSAQATCPAGYRVTGGGFAMNRWGPQGGATNSSAAPQNSNPNGNGWYVFAGALTGQSCFAAYAVCGK